MPSGCRAQPSQTFLLGERWALQPDGNLNYQADFYDPKTYTPLDAATGTFVTSNPFPGVNQQAWPHCALRLSHRGRSNYACGDGHVELLDFRDTMTLGYSTPPNRWTGVY